MPVDYIQADSDDVGIADASALDLSGDNTCMCRFKLAASGGTPIFTLFSKWRGTGSDIPYQLRIQSSTTTFRLGLLYGHTTGGEDSLAGSADSISRDVWYHAAMRLSGTTAEIFIDGVSDASETQDASGLVNSDGGFCIGARNADQNMQGMIEDVQIYSRALSNAEILAIARSAGQASIVNGIVARWLMNERAPGVVLGATTVRDIGPNNLHAASVGGSPIYAAGVASFRRKAA